jgi:hypothetical protein
MLPCLNNYTLFENQLYNLDGSYNLYNAITVFECKALCELSSRCFGFNFDGMHFQCFLLLTDTFSPMNLVPIDRFVTGFYMKSLNDCIEHHSHIIIFLVFIMTFSVFLPLCCIYNEIQNKNKNINRRYDRLALRHTYGYSVSKEV